MRNLKIPVALRDGKLVGPEDCSLSGRACGAICVDCKEPLLKRTRRGARAHFSHLSNGCSKESILHAAGKIAILEANPIWLPPEKECLPYYPRQIVHIPDAKNGREVRKIFLDYEDVESWKAFHPSESCEEQYIPDNTLRADAVTTNPDGETIFWEVFVKNRDLQKKIGRYESQGLNAVELNLSGLLVREWTKEELKSIAEGQTDLKKWLSNQRSRLATQQAEDFLRITSASKGMFTTRKSRGEEWPKTWRHLGQAIWGAIGYLNGAQQSKVADMEESIKLTHETCIWMLHPKGKNPTRTTSDGSKRVFEFDENAPWTLVEKTPNGNALMQAKECTGDTCRKVNILKPEQTSCRKCGAPTVEFDPYSLPSRLNPKEWSWTPAGGFASYLEAKINSGELT
jgi:hypothetical protein